MAHENPFAAPTADPGSAMPVSAGDPIPISLKKSTLELGIKNKVCLQCGQNNATRTIERTFQWVPPWVWIGILFNIIILMILYFIGRKTAKTSFGFCEGCAEAERAARKNRGISIAVAIIAPIMVIIMGAVVDVPAIAIIGLVGFIPAIIWAVMVHMRTKPDVILCQKIDNDKNIVTLRVSPAWGSVLKKELPDILTMGF